MSPLPFSKTWKKYPNFGKKFPDVGHFWVKFLIQNANFRGFREKKPVIFFLRGLSFSYCR